MVVLPQEVRDAWADRKGPALFATADRTGTPNVIYVTCVALFGEDKFLVADNYFDKTRKNLAENPRGALLFMTNGSKTYQVKGVLSYHTEGEIFDNMKTWNPTEHPGHAAVALTVEEIYSGAAKVC